MAADAITVVTVTYILHVCGLNGTVSCEQPVLIVLLPIVEVPTALTASRLPLACQSRLPLPGSRAQLSVCEAACKQKWKEMSLNILCAFLVSAPGQCIPAL